MQMYNSVGEMEMFYQSENYLSDSKLEYGFFNAK